MKKYKSKNTSIHQFAIQILCCSIAGIGLLLSNASSVNAQPYESIFGEDSSSWNSSYEILVGRFVDSVMYTANDTIIDTTEYKVVNSLHRSFETYYFREDSLTGSVYYFTSSDSIERKIMDLSLNVNDKFYLYQFNNQDSITVDSVYYQDNRKHIRLDFVLNKDSSDEQLTFIEGVGTNAGIIYYHLSSHFTFSYLLCAWKDGTQIHSNTLHDGKCRLKPIYYSVEENLVDDSRIKLYPNPASNTLTFEFTDFTDNPPRRIEWYNASGQKVRTDRINAETRQTLDVAQMASGMYFIAVFGNDGQIGQEKVVIQK